MTPCTVLFDRLTVTTRGAVDEAETASLRSASGSTASRASMRLLWTHDDAHVVARSERIAACVLCGGATRPTLEAFVRTIGYRPALRPGTRAGSEQYADALVESVGYDGWLPVERGVDLAADVA